jgi:8-oxo-dGTP pyrophosphatase MutT (NUDIX family)
MSETPAIPAATLVVIRDRYGQPPELLMVERAQTMAFAGGALVFPGGRIDEHDGALGGNDVDAAKIAAIRETIEETAIPCGIKPLRGVAQSQSLQAELLADRRFEDVLHEAGAELDLDALTPFARWVPKFHATRRFDTLFFVAAAPRPDWSPRICGGECTAAFWISASDALERERSGDARLIFPTRRNLERLALHSTFEVIRRDAEAHPIDPISPWVEEIAGENFITIPEGIGYPVTREKLDGLWRG